jgi:hypothetical protein
VSCRYVVEACSPLLFACSFLRLRKPFTLYAHPRMPTSSTPS